jgi:septum formation topological specificity factor MinE
MRSLVCTRRNNFVLISSEMRHQVRERLQMILSSMELDRPQEMVEHTRELVNIMNRYLGDERAPRVQ